MSTAPPDPPPPGQPGDPETAAEELYAGFLAAESGDFEALLRAHPQHAAELRGLHAEWEELAGLRGELERPEHQPWNPLDGFARSGPDHGRPERTADTECAWLESAAGRREAIARYRFEREVGRGGMGVVLQVRDEDLDRDVAMKVLPSGSAQEDLQLGRFLEEAQVTGRLDHPGIVPVHDVGADGRGQAFFTMKLVRGEDLLQVFSQLQAGKREWTHTRVLRALLDVCEAMAHAHARGIVHRDLKPSNIMVGDFGEVYVMDWGLARWTNRPEQANPVVEERDDARGPLSAADAMRTRQGQVLGTPGYMAPEQAEGRPAGPLADVYAVGAMLYHLLAGRAPHAAEGDGPRTILGRTRRAEHQAIEDLDQNAPAELVAITERAMARAPEERYTSMEALADDLRAYLEGRVVAAYETGALAQMRTWVRRNRPLAAALAAGILITLTGLAATAWLQTRARERQVLARTELEERNAALQTTRAELTVAQADAEQSEREANAQALEATRERQVADGVTRFLRGVFETLDPAWSLGREVTVAEALELGQRTIPRDDSLDPLVRARLLDVMGRAESSLGRHDKAAGLFQEALTALDGNVEPLDPRRLRSEGHLASVRTSLGDPGSLEELERLAGLASETLGPRAQTSLELRAEYATALNSRFEHFQALRQLEPLLDDFVATYGEDHPDVEQMLVTYGQVLIACGRVEEAREVLERIHAKVQAELGARHPRTINSLASLGLFHVQTDRIPRAFELLTEAASAAREVWGDDHPSTLTIRSNLAQCLMRMRRFAEAEEEMLFLHELRIASLGEAHDQVLGCRSDLASLYLYWQRFEEAQEWSLSAYETALTLHGDSHPTGYAMLTNLAHAAEGLGQEEEAEAMLLEALAGMRETQGPDHIETLGVLWSLAYFYNARERFEDALPLARELVERTPRDRPRFGERQALYHGLTTRLEEEEGR